MKVHTVRAITIHHAGVPTRSDVPIVTKLRNLQAWCQREDQLAGGRKKPAWPDIPYHYYVFADGTVAECRKADYVGDTNTTYDPTGHLLICLEGNFETETPPPAQLAAMEAMTRWASRKYQVPRIRIGAHGDYAQTDCPGKNLLPAVRSLRTSF